MAKQVIDLNIIPNWRGVSIDDRRMVVDPKLPLTGIIGNPIDEVNRMGGRLSRDAIVRVFHDSNLVRFQISSVDWVNLKAQLITYGEIENIDELALSFCFYTDDWYERGDLKSKLTDVIGGYLVSKAEQEQLSKVPNTHVGGVVRDYI